MNLLQTFLKYLFFSLKKKKKRFYKLPGNLFTNYCKLYGNLFFFFKKKKKEILQTSRKPLYKKGFKKVQVSTGTALAFILLETAKKKEILQTSRKPLHKLLQTFRKSLFFFLTKKKRDFTNFPETSLQKRF